MTWYARSGEGYVTLRTLRWDGPPSFAVAQGFRFNVSVPRWLRWLVDPHDERLLLAACLHDWALLRRGCSRAVAAGVWVDALENSGVSRMFRMVTFVVLGLWKFD